MNIASNTRSSRGGRNGSYYAAYLAGLIADGGLGSQQPQPLFFRLVFVQHLVEPINWIAICCSDGRKEKKKEPEPDYENMKPNKPPAATADMFVQSCEDFEYRVSILDLEELIKAEKAINRIKQKISERRDKLTNVEGVEQHA